MYCWATASAMPWKPFSTICRYAFDAATPTTALAVSLLRLIEDDYFGHAYRDRPTDLWECIESWPPEARKEAFDVLLPTVSEQMSTSG
jgi:hypothetical protein